MQSGARRQVRRREWKTTGIRSVCLPTREFALRAPTSATRISRASTCVKDVETDPSRSTVDTLLTSRTRRVLECSRPQKERDSDGAQ